MSPKYTAAIVGCGAIGHAHMDGYNLVDEVEVIAVADPVEAAREQYVQEYGQLQGYGTVEQLLAEARPDIVSVCTWHGLHPQPTIAAALAMVIILIALPALRRRRSAMETVPD